MNTTSSIGSVPYFYGLLYLAPNESSSMVLGNKNYDEQISIYLGNAVLLSKSFLKEGYTFTLITNNKLELENLLSAAGYSLDVKEISFTRKIPSGIRFYSAHYKLDIYSYFAGLKGQYSVLCDLDMVCLGMGSEAFLNSLSTGKPLVYDITNQVCYDYGKNIVFTDLKLIAPSRCLTHWYGGEFIGGKNDFYQKLSIVVDEVFLDYLGVIEQLNHVGDEAVTSVALGILQERGVSFSDAGKICGIGRYWNCGKPLVFQRNFSYFKECFLLHLPADKAFLSYHKYSTRETFLKSYFKLRHLSLASLLRKGKKLIRHGSALLTNKVKN